MDDKIEEIIKLCYEEFCEWVGNSPAGCDACPYGKYGEHCFEVYMENKLDEYERLGC